MYKIRNWFTRIRRAIRWFSFIYKQTYCDDYAILLQTWEYSLIEMAKHFERTDITITSLQDAVKMREVAELINTFIVKNINGLP